MEKIVWKFTNKRELTEKEFIRYFEKKVKSTIRKYHMPVGVLKKQTLKAKVLNFILQNLQVRKGKIGDENLNSVTNKIIYVLMHGNEKNLKKLMPKNQPLYFLSNKEIELYAEIKKIKGKSPAEKGKGKLKEIDDFLSRIEEKNQDIRQNIVQALINAG